MEEELTKKARAYALKNAIEHGGKAVEGAVISALFHEGMKKEDAGQAVGDIKKIVRNVNSLSADEQKKEHEQIEDLISHRKEREGLQELPNVKGRPVMRLAPYPSGALHLGNAKTYVLNALYAEKYNGRLILVMDDTIGSEQKQLVKEAYKMIPEAFDWLGIKYEKPIIYKSDRLKIYYEYAEKLIKMGRAYVCSCNQETLRYNRARGIECGCRNYSVAKQLDRWKTMFSAREGECTLRIKTDMKHPNPAFRDRVLFRISEREHPRVGNKYGVWPLLDFSWAIDDHLLGITHIIRGKDLMMESEMEKYIWDIFGWKHPELLHAGLVRIEGIGAKISKSKAQHEVKSGQFSGWDDPRTWSVQSLRKRGIQPEAIRQFVESIGLNQSDIAVPVDILYALNRKIVHEKAIQAQFKKIEKTGMEAEGKAEIIKQEVKENSRKKSGESGKNIKVVMPDASVVFGLSDVKPKKDSIYHFIGLGYCRYESKEKTFYFAHP